MPAAPAAMRTPTPSGSEPTRRPFRIVRAEFEWILREGEDGRGESA